MPVGARPGGTTARGYGQQHQVARKRALADFTPGVTVCARGGEVMWANDLPELDHTDDRTGYLGLSCRRHNRGARPGAPLEPAGLVAHNHDYWINERGHYVHRDRAFRCCTADNGHSAPW